MYPVILDDSFIRVHLTTFVTIVWALFVDAGGK